MTPSSLRSYQFLESTPSSLLLHYVTNTTNMGHTLPTPPLTTSGPHTTSYPPPGSIPPPASTATSSAHSPRPNTTTPIFSNNEPTTTTPTNPAAHQSVSHHLMAQPQSTASILNIDPAPARTHTMVTRSQRGIVKPLESLSLHISFVSPILKSPFLGLKDQNWCNAMYLAFGRHLEEINMTMAHLEKKQTRLRTNTMTLQNLKSQSLETASPFIHDAVTLHLVTASQHLLTASARTDSTRI
ncbi:hypothetical protein Tco_0708539 [Tanacetum coccineum]